MSFFHMMGSSVDRYIPADYDFLVFFPQQDKKTGFSMNDMFEICKELGMAPYWNSIRVSPACAEGEVQQIAFKIKPLPTYDDIQRARIL